MIMRNRNAVNHNLLPPINFIQNKRPQKYHDQTSQKHVPLIVKHRIDCAIQANAKIQQHQKNHQKIKKFHLFLYKAWLGRLFLFRYLACRVPIFTDSSTYLLFGLLSHSKFGWTGEDRTLVDWFTASPLKPLGYGPHINSAQLTAE